MNCDGGYGGHQARDPKIEGMAGRAPAENPVEPPEAAAQMSSSTSWTSRAGAGSGLGPRVSGLGIGDWGRFGMDLGLYASIWRV